MAKVQKVVYGDVNIRLAADDNGYKLFFHSENGNATFETPTKRGMSELISTLTETLHDIYYQLGTYGSVFKGICDDEGQEENG